MARLTESTVKRIAKAGRYGSGPGGHGLSLLVKPRAGGGWSKTFSQRLRLPDGTVKFIGLGVYGVLTLEEARDKALENVRAVAKGIDPTLSKSTVPTFAVAMEAVIENRRPSWKGGGSESNWRGGLKNAGRLMERRVDQITTADVLAVLRPVNAKSPDAARRLRAIISSIMDWAEDYRDDPNPAGRSLNAKLPKPKKAKAHHAALDYSKVSGVLDAVRGAQAWLGARLAIEFVAYTAVRSGEARGATWDEIDLAAAVWTIPASRMKANAEHRVPLSTAALDVLGAARDTFGDTGLVFPSATGRVMISDILSRVLKGTGQTVQGLRSSFRDWAAERGTDWELAETALAHSAARGAVEAAYLRSTLTEQRRPIMQAWADYVLPTEAR